MFASVKFEVHHVCHDMMLLAQVCSAVSATELQVDTLCGVTSDDDFM